MGSLAAQRDVHGNPDPASVISSGTFHFLHALKAQTSTWDSIRALSELNRPNEADAYPWLSSDGLRLYYTKGGTQADSIIMVSRASTSDPFGNPVGLNINFPSGKTLSPWLTDDELHLFFTTDSAVAFGPRMLLHSTRATTSDPWGASVRVTLNGNLADFITGPSLNQDLSQLYLVGAPVTGNQVFIYDRTGPDSYTLVDTLPLAPGTTDITPGQLSSDGLRYYNSKDDGVNPNQIGYFSRTTPADPFGNYALLNGLLNNTGNAANQPSLNGLEDMILVSFSTSDSWTANDLYLAECLDSITGQFELLPAMDKFAVRSFPNPAQDRVTLDFSAWPDAHPTAMILTDLMGQELQHIPLNRSDQSLSLDVSLLSPAAYIYRFQLPSGEAKTGKIVVAR